LGTGSRENKQDNDPSLVCCPRLSPNGLAAVTQHTQYRKRSNAGSR